MSLMTRPDFPFPLAGLVHVQNTTEQRQPIGADQVLSLSVHAEAFREHDRGHAIDLVTTATVDETVAWHERSSYLRRSRVTREPDRTREHRETPTAAALWRVGRDAGTAYAKVSGDRNPIHTSRLGARLFGFPRPIAHGMWTLARCLAALGGRLPEAYTVDVQFKAPVLLPGTVAFTTGRDAAGRWRFGLHEPRSGKPHLTGTAG
jgi:acyl dehydratase